MNNDIVQSQCRKALINPPNFFIFFIFFCEYVMGSGKSVLPDGCRPDWGGHPSLEKIPRAPYGELFVACVHANLACLATSMENWPVSIPNVHILIDMIYRQLTSCFLTFQRSKAAAIICWNNGSFKATTEAYGGASAQTEGCTTSRWGEGAIVGHSRPGRPWGS